MERKDFWTVDKLMPPSLSTFSGDVPLSSLSASDAPAERFGAPVVPASRVICEYRLSDPVTFPSSLPSVMLSPDFLAFYNQIRQNRKSFAGYPFLQYAVAKTILEEKNPSSVYDTLLFLWRSYRDEYPLLEKLFWDTLCDYSLYSHTKPPFDAISEYACNARALVRPFFFQVFVFDYLFGEDHTVTPDEIRFLIRQLSGSDYRRSKAYLTNVRFREALDDCLYTAFREGLINRGALNTALFSLPIPSGVKTTRLLFQDLPVGVRPEGKVRLVYLPLLFDESVRSRFEGLIRYAENGIRSIFGIRQTVMRSAIPAEHRAFLDLILAQYRNAQAFIEPETKQPYIPRKIEVDTARANEIENASRRIVSDLTKNYDRDLKDTVTLGETPQNSEPPIRPKLEESIHGALTSDKDTSESEYLEFAALLSEMEDEFISVALYEGTDAARRYAAAHGAFFESLLASCNSKAMDATGDGIFDAIGNIYSDYRDALQTVFFMRKDKDNG